MSHWSASTLVRIDDEYDRESADTGAALDSRFGKYLSDRIDWLDEDDHRDPVAFTLWAWGVATPPVMSPGYVRLRPDLQALRLVRSQEDGALAVEISLPLPHHALAREARPPYAVGDWETDHYSSPGAYRAQVPPHNEAKPWVLLSALLRVPAADWRLHQPGNWTRLEELMVDDAKQAVATLADHINREAGPKAAALLGDQGGAW